jgi:hypothetical protein
MFKLGKLQDSKPQKPTYTFKDLLNNAELMKAFKDEAKQGLGILTVILLPQKYPSGAFIFDFPSFKLKKTMKGDELINWLKAEGFSKSSGKDKVQYRLKLTDDGELIVYELPIALGGYAKTDYGFKFTDKDDKEELDIW